MAETVQQLRARIKSHFPNDTPEQHEARVQAALESMTSPPSKPETSEEPRPSQPRTPRPSPPPSEPRGFAFKDGRRVCTVTVGSPATFTCNDHGFKNGDRVMVGGGFVTSPDVSGERLVSVLSPNSFAINVNVTSIGAGGDEGTVQKL